MRWIQRMMTAAVLSMGIVAVTVGVSYGQDKVAITYFYRPLTTRAPRTIGRHAAFGLA